MTESPLPLRTMGSSSVRRSLAEAMETAKLGLSHCAPYWAYKLMIELDPSIPTRCQQVLWPRVDVSNC